MKTHKHLWEQFIDPENIKIAAHRAVRSKRRRKSTRRFLKHPDEKLAALRKSLCDGTYKTSPYTVFDVYEPKRRTIFMLPLYPDHIIHHAIINILGPIWQKMFISDSFACIPGRGLHAASRRCAHLVRRNKYVLQCDIRKFYPSINHDIMMRVIRRKISDKRMVALLDNIVRSIGGDHGLPIGNLTSQWLGNVYLHELDLFVKHKLRVTDYIRYCDDFCLFSNDRRQLDDWAAALHEFLDQNLDLHFSRCFIQPTAHGVGFIGYRHYDKFIKLTRAGARKIRKKFIDIIHTADVSASTRSKLAAYNGWLRAGCTYNFRHCLISCATNGASPEFIRFLRKYF